MLEQQELRIRNRLPVQLEQVQSIRSQQQVLEQSNRNRLQVQNIRNRQQVQSNHNQPQERVNRIRHHQGCHEVLRTNHILRHHHKVKLEQQELRIRNRLQEQNTRNQILVRHRKAVEPVRSSCLHRK